MHFREINDYCIDSKLSEFPLEGMMDSKHRLCYPCEMAYHAWKIPVNMSLCAWTGPVSGPPYVSV